MIIIAVAASVLVPAVTLAWYRGYIIPIVPSAVILSLTLVGAAKLDQTHGGDTFGALFVGVSSLLIGYFLVVPRDVQLVEVRGVVRPDRFFASLVVFATVILTMAVYHFVAGGIPLLSQNVEVARFDFAGSGLLGLPGRMYLFGLPFLVIFVSVFHARHPFVSCRWLLRLVWCVFAATQVLSGFKGALFGLLATFLLVRAVAGRPLDIRGLFRPRIMAIGASAAVLAYLLSFRYGSLQVLRGSEAIAYLEDRLTVVQAQPGYVAMTQFGGPHHAYWAGDFVYTFKKYTSRSDEIGSLLPLELLVSARLAQLPIGADFIAPTTVGAYAGWYADYGAFGAAFALLICGAGYGFAYLRATQSPRAWRAALWGFGAYLGGLYIVKGNIAYYFVNGLAVAAFLAVTWFVCLMAISMLPMRADSRPHGGQQSRMLTIPTATDIP
jgi:hypothetical protein